MAPRAFWTGHLRLSLVNIPVRLYPATSSERRIELHQIHEPSGKRIRYEKIVPGIGPVDTSEIVKGYEVEKGKYVLLTDEELDDVKLEARKVIDLVQFVDQDEVDPLFFERPFYVTPEEGDETARDAYVVLRDALKKTNKIGLGQLAVRGRSNIVAVKPFGKGLLLEELRYASEIRKADPFFIDIAAAKPDADMVKLAQELIERKAGPFKPEQFKDKYAEAVNELIEAKLANRPPESIEEPIRTAQVIDLMEALKRSVRGGEGAKPARDAEVTPIKRKAAAATAKRSPSRSKKPSGGGKKSASKR